MKNAIVILMLALGTGLLARLLHLYGRELSGGRARADAFLSECKRDVLLRILLEDADVAVLEDNVAFELHVVENLLLEVG